MVRLFARLWIKNADDVSDPRVRQSYGMLCGGFGIFFNILLCIFKWIAAWITGSVSIAADAFNNLSDAGSSIVTLIGFRLAGQKPDPSHPFGHGRMEYLSGLFVSMLILLMGFELGKTSVEKIISGSEIRFKWISVIILAVSILVKLYMFLYNRGIGKMIRSSAMTVTATDSLNDCISTGVVLICTILSRFIDFNLDAWCGLAVALFILWSGIRSAKETIDPLLGMPPEPEFIDEIHRIVTGYSEITGIHDLIVHNYGPGRVMLSLHAEVPQSGNILALHDTIDNIEHRLSEELHCSAVIHMDPIATDDALTMETRKKIAELVSGIDRIITIHDFRMVTGHTHTNLIFDVVVPFRFRLSDEELLSEINRRIKELSPNFRTIINIDKAYTRRGE